MDLKVLFLGVCLCVFAVTYSQAGIPKCCMSTKDIPRRILLNVQRWEFQPSTGACDIPALILHVKNLQRPICAHPKVKRALLRVQSRRKRSHRKDSD
ncbi:C-C motif chemokine 27a [Periophthalmus magnuspinnatus]|uniref:C-C motif chemokine 27a n=1 Tax=Periophthalmus magnuspinnatus TaxID=409849 RepID=UPI00145B82B8|nr:C-C motif chemokine 27a [Periophthalmus magnuspinnatus]